MFLGKTEASCLIPLIKELFMKICALENKFRFNNILFVSHNISFDMNFNKNYLVHVQVF